MGQENKKQGKRREKVRQAVTGRRESCQGQRRDSHSYKQRSGKEDSYPNSYHQLSSDLSASSVV